MRRRRHPGNRSTPVKGAGEQGGCRVARAIDARDVSSVHVRQCRAMRLATKTVCALMFVVPMVGFVSAHARAQTWSGILDPTRATDWSGAGAGTIPARATLCSTLGMAGQAPTFVQSVTVAQINSALRAARAGQTVLLEPGDVRHRRRRRSPSRATSRCAAPGPTQDHHRRDRRRSHDESRSSSSGRRASFPYRPRAEPGTSTAITAEPRRGRRRSPWPARRDRGRHAARAHAERPRLHDRRRRPRATCTYCNGVGGALGPDGPGHGGQRDDAHAQRSALHRLHEHVPSPFRSRSGATSAGPRGSADLGVGRRRSRTRASDRLQLQHQHDRHDLQLGQERGERLLRGLARVDRLQHAQHDPRQLLPRWLLPRAGRRRTTSCASASRRAPTSIENNIFWRQHTSLMLEFGASGQRDRLQLLDAATTTSRRSPAARGLLLSRPASDDEPLRGQHHDALADGRDPRLVEPQHDLPELLDRREPLSAAGRRARGPADEQPDAGERRRQHAFMFSTSRSTTTWSASSTAPTTLVNTLMAASRLVSPATNSNPACISWATTDGNSVPARTYTDHDDALPGRHGLHDAGTFQWQDGMQTLPPSFYLRASRLGGGASLGRPSDPDVTGGDFTDWANPTAAIDEGPRQQDPGAALLQPQHVEWNHQHGLLRRGDLLHDIDDAPRRRRRHR